jgi:methionyl aminopeptidase
LLEIPDLSRERRLGNVQTRSSSGQIPFFGDGDEVLELRKTHGAPLPRFARDAKPSRCHIKMVLDALGAVAHFGVMSVEILSPRSIQSMRLAGRVAALTLSTVALRLTPGISTDLVDTWVREDTRRRGGRPSQLGYHGFPAAVCVSPNNVVCHGIPKPSVVLRDGDIVNVDVTTEVDGHHGDTSATFFIGKPSPEAQHVVDVARRCRTAGIEQVREGARLGDIGAAIEELAKREGCSVVREYGGHGIGRQMHTAPHVSHVGKRGSGLRLRAGMVFTIEPMINLGGPAVKQLDDGWTVVTADDSLSAQFEHTVLVTKTGYEILTPEPESV